jgi:hypothetical protein
MQYFQILTCNDTLGTCCTDFALATVLDIVRKFFNIFQIIVPILLIIGVTIQLIKLMNDPERKNGIKEITNRAIAALICFFIPVIVDVVLGMVSQTSTFKIADCWELAKISSEVSQAGKARYIDPNKGDERKSILIDPSLYKPGTPSNPTGTTPKPGNGQSSMRGAEIVAYAKRFVGQRYVYGGTWNGELPYTPTDCSGFVQGVFRHFGIQLNRTTSTQWAAKSTYQLVSPADIRAGDLVMYDGHVGILTGIGTEVVHAKGSKWGVVLDPDYRTCSSHAILGIMRINGVN